ncbi:MAG: hypothetical protein J2P57_06500 [Acidimicrobiaceae bacterium]|nr:hypothetical protein [Acidimicrobiaceae bacterium]
MKSVAALLSATAVAVAACSSGSALRGPTSVAVKAALKANNINYRGDVTCRGSRLPISCTSTATDGRTIAATLSRAKGDCVLVVTVGSTQISRNKVACP